MEKCTWSKRRRAYVFGICDSKWNLTRTMTVFLCIVCEKTLGFSKEKDKISLSQFQERMGQISERQLRTIRTELARLEFMHYVAGKGRENLSQYSIEEDRAKWIVRPRPGTWRKGEIYTSSFNKEENHRKGEAEEDKRGSQTGKKGKSNELKGEVHTPPTEGTEDTGFTGKTQEQDNATPSDPERGCSGFTDNATPRDRILNDMLYGCNIDCEPSDLNTIADTLVERGYEDIGSKLDELWLLDKNLTMEEFLKEFPDLTDF